jgi:mannosyl-oligosaccharide glucosidase
MDTFSSHHGIVNVFPVAFGLFDDNDKLENSLRFTADKEQLFSPYGLRGVAKGDEQYIPGMGYWRGPVWVSVNYLVLRGLYQNYLGFEAATPLDAAGTMKSGKDLYDAVRFNMLHAVYDNWVPQHLFYENFNDVTGKGQYSHPFTGWTTLILLILSEKYI